MRVIKPDPILYAKIFDHMGKSIIDVTAWQVRPDSQERVVTQTALRTHSKQMKLLNFQRRDHFEFNMELPVYFYAPDGQVIFKCDLKEMSDTYFAVGEPTEIQVLDAPESEKMARGIGVDVKTVWKSRRFSFGGPETYSSYIKPKGMNQRSARDKDYLNTEFELTLDEEDKIFAHKRTSKRSRPKFQKTVNVAPAGSFESYTLKLFDLSRGGLSFVSEDIKQFALQTDVKITGFDGFELDDPLYATIMSHRAMDDGNEHKIGVKFIEETQEQAPAPKA